jgi:hypothetical protein
MMLMELWKTHVVFVFYIAGVTHLDRCKIRWSIRGHNRNQKHVVRIIANMSPGLMVWNDAKDGKSALVIGIPFR